MNTDTYFTDVTVHEGCVLQLPEFRAIRYLKTGPLGWERERIASMRLNLGSNDVVLDVGAESGDMTALFATWVREIQVMEPNPVAWPNIRAIFDANAIPAPSAHWVGFASNLTTVAPNPSVPDPFGLGWPACADGAVTPEHGFRHLAEETDTTPQITIDDFVARAGAVPTAITMDIEGAELQALTGARRLLVEHRPLVWVSVHPEFLRHHFRQTPADVYGYLESLDYRVTHLADDHETHIFAEPR